MDAKYTMEVEGMFYYVDKPSVKELKEIKERLKKSLDHFNWFVFEKDGISIYRLITLNDNIEHDVHKILHELTLVGSLLVNGEEYDDVWRLVALPENKLSVERARLIWPGDEGYDNEL